MKNILYTSIATVIVLIVLGVKSKAIHTASNYDSEGFITLNIDLDGIDPAMLLPKCSAVLYTGDALDLGIPAPGTSSITPIDINSSQFTLKLPMKSRLAYLKVYILKKNSLLSFGNLIVSAGDDLSIKLDKDGFNTITGNSSIINAQINFLNGLINSDGIVLKNANEIPIAFNKCDSLIQAHQLNTNNKDVWVVNVYNKQIEAITKTKLLDVLRRAGRAHQELKVDIYQFLRSKQDSWQVNIEEPYFRDVLSLPMYIYFYQTVLLEFGPKSDVSFFSHIYNEIRSNYPSFVADKATAYLFWKQGKRNGNNQMLLENAINSVKDSASLSVMNEIWRTKRQGITAFNFELPDEHVKIRSLKEFRGKTVFIHFWFTGCPACITLAKELSPIIEKLKSNPNIQFISVNVDRNREKWLKSLQSDQYANKNELNLYTSDLGSDHPFLKYYNFKSFPSILIIDAFGNVITANPPSPNYGVTGDQFEAYIRSCIKD